MDEPPDTAQDRLLSPAHGLQMTEAEALRRAHRWHESHLRSMGGLMVLFGACALFPGLLLFGIVSFSATAAVLAEGDPLGVLRFVWPTLSVGLLFSTSGALFLVAGLGLRRLDPNLRLGASLVVCLWLLKVSALSVLTPLALYLLWSRAGRVVLSPRYQAAMRLTPHIPSRWSVLFWLALPLVVWGFRVWTKARFFDRVSRVGWGLMDRNPYAPPAADLGEVTPPPEPEIEGGMTLAEAEALRRTYLTHEARLQSVGTMMLPCAVNVVVGPLTGLVGVVALLAMDMEPAPAPVLARLMIVMVGLLLTAFGVMSSVGGLGLWHLDPKHRTLNTVVATVWLVTFWCFCPLGLWALYLLRSSAGAVVLSPKYAEARRRTPHIRFNSHRETARALALLVLGVTLVNLRAWLG